MSLHPTSVFATRCDLVRDKSGELVSCVGIDVQAASGAPVGEGCGVDIGSDDGYSEASLMFLAALGIHPPKVITGVEFVLVGHDRLRGVVMLGLVPDHADDADSLVVHGCALSDGVIV